MRLNQSKNYKTGKTKKEQVMILTIAANKNVYWL